MVFVRKFLPFLLLLSLCVVAEDDVFTQFLRLYYSGDYQKAHELIGHVQPGTWKQEVWDGRIHAQAQIDGCPIRAHAEAAAEGLALLRIGDFASAPDCFTDDWLSQYGRATLADWEGNDREARDAIRKAMALSPENEDLLYFAANVAPNREMTLDFFGQFLDLNKDDPYRKAVAQYSIDFIKKTWDIPLNVPVEISGVEPVDSDYKNNQLIIHAMINGKEKVSLLLDTGAGGMTLKERNWQPQLTTDMMMLGIGKKQASRSLRMVLNHFQAGRYELKNPVAAMTGVPLPDVDGIAGTSLFSRYYMLVPLKSGIDFTLFTCDQDDPTTCLEAQKLHFSEKITVPFYCINQLIIVKGRIRNSPENLDMMVDTGASRSIVASAAAKRYAHINYPLSKELGEKRSLSGIGGKTNDVLVAENVEVNMGGIKKSFNALPAMNLGESSEALELELDMIVGRDFLQGYTLLIDYRNRQLTFLR